MTRAEKKLRPLGWKVSHTDPLQQRFHFDRFLGKRRVAGVIVQAKTEPKAWKALLETLQENAPEDCDD